MLPDRGRMQLFLSHLEKCDAAPLLTVLEIFYTAGDQDQFDVDTPLGMGCSIFHGNTPLLEDVRLVNVYLDWRSPLFHNLKTFDLCDPLYANLQSRGIHSLDIIHILRALPQLTSLTLGGFNYEGWSQQKYVDPIELHSLSQLTITFKFFSPDHAEALFALISTPNLISLTLNAQTSDINTNFESLMETLCQSRFQCGHNKTGI